MLVLMAACNAKPEPQRMDDSVSHRPRIADSNGTARAGINPYLGVDISPMDMIYLPVNYPKNADRNAQPVARIIYSRPQKQGRAIFGNLVKYGTPWRLGANEATEMEVFQPITIQKTTIPRGRYTLYCMPGEQQWTIVFNKSIYGWGLDIDTTQDLHRFPIPVVRTAQSVEYFTMAFQQKGAGAADLLIAWDNAEGRLPIQYKEP